MIIDRDEARRRVTDAVLAMYRSDQSDPEFVAKIINRLMSGLDANTGTPEERAEAVWLLMQQSLFVGLFLARMAENRIPRDTLVDMLMDYRNDDPGGSLGQPPV